jgi:hypothetical protein
MQILLECMLGWDIKKKTTRGKGILGIVVAFSAADEEQGMKTLHCHWQIWVTEHGGRDDLILRTKLIRIALETSSFWRWLLWREFVFFAKLCAIQIFYDYLRSFPTGYPVISRSKS